MFLKINISLDDSKLKMVSSDNTKHSSNLSIVVCLIIILFYNVSIYLQVLFSEHVSNTDHLCSPSVF